MAANIPTVEDSICEKWSEARSTLDQYLRDGEAYVREEPLKAIGYAAAAGYILRILPVTGILASAVRLILAAVKPAALVYGAAKAYEVLARNKEDQQKLL